MPPPGKLITGLPDGGNAGETKLLLSLEHAFSENNNHRDAAGLHLLRRAKVGAVVLDIMAGEIGGNNEPPNERQLSTTIGHRVCMASVSVVKYS